MPASVDAHHLRPRHVYPAAGRRHPEVRNDEGPEPVGLGSFIMMVGDTGIEPVTSSVSGKRAPAAPIARGGYRIRTGVNGFAGRCLTSRPTHHEMLGLGAPGSSERMTGLEPATLTLAR